MFRCDRMYHSSTPIKLSTPVKPSKPIYPNYRKVPEGFFERPIYFPDSDGKIHMWTMDEWRRWRRDEINKLKINSK